MDIVIRKNNYKEYQRRYGRFPLRLPIDLDSLVRKKAMAKGMSINKYISMVLEESLLQEVKANIKKIKSDSMILCGSTQQDVRERG